MHHRMARLALIGPLVALALAPAACGSSGAAAPRAAGGASAPATLPAPIAVPTAASTTPALAFVPVIDQDFADPDVIRVGSTYYAYATQGAGYHIQVARSSDLEHWTVLDRDALPAVGAWARDDETWAPGVSALGGRRGYVMYYAAHSRSPDLQCVGVAVAANPEGPFRPASKRPLVCPASEGGAIDPAPFQDRDGRRYVIWKNDGNCCGKPTWLQLQPVSADGTRITGTPKKLIRATESWEGGLIEAPTLWLRDGRYYLFYSADSYGGVDYKIGYAVADRIGGPYRKSSSPLATTIGLGTQVLGPGGQDVLTDDHGRTLIVFHGWDIDITYRGMYVDTLEWKDGAPVVALPWEH
jgi:arabinan endo-1,5-alpha-L-arabinosidase